MQTINHTVQEVARLPLIGPHATCFRLVFFLLLFSFNRPEFVAHRRNTCIGASITFSGQICGDVTQLRQEVARAYSC